MSYINDLLFGVYPYIAGAVFLIASWIRYDREQYTWRAGSSQMLNSKGFRRASNLFTWVCCLSSSAIWWVC